MYDTHLTSFNHLSVASIFEIPNISIYSNLSETYFVFVISHHT
jgi:hypothetical protein